MSAEAYAKQFGVVQMCMLRDMMGFDQLKGISEIVVPGNVRTHRSFETIEKLRNVEQPSFKMVKPIGLWYGIDGEWEKYLDKCIPDVFIEIAKTYKLDVSTSNLLVLDSRKKVHEFAKEFLRNGGIHWNEVAAKYDGIEFNPYFPDIRYECSWTGYYALDCPSGCLWNTEKVLFT